MKKLSLVFILCTFLNACSLSSSNKEDVTSRPSDELEFAVDSIGESSPQEMKVEEQPIVESQIPDQIAPGEKIEEIASIVHNEGIEKEMTNLEEPKFKDYKKKDLEPVAKVAAFEPKIDPMAEPKIEPKIEPIYESKVDSPVEIVESRASDPTKYGALEQYHVQKGDTLMMVAFKIYGDYRKWKDLKEWNKGKLPAKIAPGVVLKYYVPGQNFGWRPSGLPYMVKTGDNLGNISFDKYGTSKKWKSIYENNRPLIRDPNLIFAGFTIYYIPTRNVASKTR